MISLLDATFAFMIAVLLLYWFRVSRRKLLSQNSVLNLHIFFGTQTGTAELYAHRLDALLSQASNVAVSVDNLKHFREESLSRDNSTLSIFIVATYGDGEPPDDATHFYDWLQAHCDPLTGLRYAVFGLGDSGYLEFNQFAKQVDCRLSLLGASRLLPLCLGDASRNIEADFRAWQRSICQLFNMTECNIDAFLKTDVQDLTFVYPSLPEVESLGGAFTGEPERLLSFRHNTPPFSSSNPFLATVTLNQELFRGTDQSCRLLELSLSGSGIKYTAGDHVAVFPQNSKELVERLCDLLQVDPEQHIHIISGLDSRRRRWNRFPTPCTFRTAFAHYLDLTTPPRFDLIEALVHYAQSESERLFLRKLTQTHLGDNTYEKWILATRRNVVELLENLPSCRPPAELLCRLLPRLQVRYYSAASSSRCQPDRLRLIVKVVKYTSLSGRLHEGVASSLLSGLQPRDRVPVFLQRSEFRLPRSPMTPIIMVATGTGLAPFLGFIQERKFIKSKGGKLGEAVLFYGCRTRREDYILADELQDALDQGVISGLHTAFSRETTHKVYVQHLMHQLADAIWSLLKTKNGHFYVCGDPRRTARGVRDALLDIIQQKGSLNSTEASEFLEQLKSARRCIFDTWT